MAEENVDTPATATTPPPVEPKPALATEGGREINPRMLYVADLDRLVTEDMLTELFKVAGTVASVKILPKNIQKGLNYAFVEYEDPKGAETALNTLNGRVLNQSPIKIKYGYQTQQAIKDSINYNVFVGDLSSDVDDDTLSKAFSQFSSMIEARVMWDMTTGRSRSYGFVSFSDESEADVAIREMDGKVVGTRPIRCNWAQKRQPASNNLNQRLSPNSNYNQLHSHHHHHQQIPQHHQHAQVMAAVGPPPPHGGPPPPMPVPTSNYDYILNQTPSWHTTVYIGNLAPYTPAQELLPILQNFGYIVEFKHQPERGYAFVRYDSHERATMAIVQLASIEFNGRMLKCGWGRERPPQPHHHH